MKAVCILKSGGREALSFMDVPAPQPARGQVLIALEFAGVNFIDVYQREGMYPLPMPFTLGTEGAGTVVAVGAEPGDFKVGDRVAYQGVQGSYAEQTVAPADRLVRIPQDIPTRTAAALMLQGLTAHYLSSSTYTLKAGDTALVHAAAGGVGLLLCQMAKLRGANVIGTVSTEAKAALARAAGADHVILYTQQDFVVETKRFTDNHGVQVVYDSVGKTTFDQSLNCLAPRGLMTLFGASSGAVPPFNPQVLNQKGSLYLTRPTLANYVASRAELLRRTDELFAWLAAGKLSVRVDREVPLKDVAEAHRALESRETTGKVLLKI
ncbi:MAG TPA: quinone oxidoreductase [Steroidobacteraceae bacterium]